MAAQANKHDQIVDVTEISIFLYSLVVMYSLKLNMLNCFWWMILGR